MFARIPFSPPPKFPPIRPPQPQSSTASPSPMKIMLIGSNRSPRSSRLAPGFTLIELLVVITILGILMGLAVGGTGAIKEQARTAQAKNDCTGLAVAVKAFFTDYSRYPIPADNTSDLFVDPSGGAGGGDSGKDQSSQASNKMVMDVLTAAESVINPRGTVYYEAKRASNSASSSSSSSGQGSSSASSSGTGPRGGLWNGSMYDPWGYTYGFAFDGDYDGKLVYSGGALKDLDDNARVIGGGAGVFSLGPRQKKSIYSW